MKLRTLFSMLLVTYGINASAQAVLVKKLNRYTNSLTSKYGSISTERKTELNALADKIMDEKMTSGHASVVFVSTDNSSLSQMSQAWMQLALDRFDVKNVSVVSYGASQSKISKETVAALKGAGFKISTNTTSFKTPLYILRYSWNGNQMVMFSKNANNHQIPTQNIVTANVDDTVVTEENALDISKQTAIEMLYVAEKIHTSQLVSMQQ